MPEELQRLCHGLWTSTFQEAPSSKIVERSDQQRIGARADHRFDQRAQVARTRVQHPAFRGRDSPSVSRATAAHYVRGALPGSFHPARDPAWVVGPREHQHHARPLRPPDGGFRGRGGDPARRLPDRRSRAGRTAGARGDTRAAGGIRLRLTGAFRGARPRPQHLKRLQIGGFRARCGTSRRPPPRSRGGRCRRSWCAGRHRARPRPPRPRCRRPPGPPRRPCRRAPGRRRGP
jgi:hypothetical protein